MTRVVCYNMSTGHRETVHEVDLAGFVFPTDLTDLVELHNAMEVSDHLAECDSCSDHTYYVDR